MLRTKSKGVLATTSSYQFIPNTCDSFDLHSRAIQFFAEMCDVDIHGAGLAVEVKSPGKLEQLFTGEDSAGLLCQSEQQIKFLGTQVKGPICEADFTGGRKNRQVTAMNGS